MGFWLTILIIGYFFICLILVLTILMQSGKGGGLSGMIGGSTLAEAFGATGAEKTLSRWTTYAAIGFFLLAIGLTIFGANYFKKATLLQKLEEETRMEQTIPTEEATLATPLSVETKEGATSPSQPQSAVSERPVEMKSEVLELTPLSEAPGESAPATPQSPEVQAPSPSPPQ